MRNQEQNKMAAVMATLFLAAAEALAQDQQQNAATEESEEPTRRIIVSIADRKLAVIENGRVVKVYPTAVGADATPSPVGVFKIANRVKDPTWYGPKGQIVPAGKANPLGDRWMGLSRKGYGIHGTNNQRSIGHNVSHGCIRMRKADVEELFELARVGDVVEMVAEPSEALAGIFSAGQLLASAE
jgi:lipoprotein-anchoring transpeptidase ErfK/SrfK